MTTSFSIDDDLQKRIENLCSGTESVSQFCYKATEERVKRLEARDERARIQLALKNEEMIAPIIEKVLKKMGIL